MKPNNKLITIKNNENLIKKFIKEMIVIPRIKAHKWSKETNQTPNLKIGYPAQHLASLILGMKGQGSAARGEDIIDGSEVKSCSKVDQVDKCKECNENVLRTQERCPNCQSDNIKRNNDSKWLIGIRNQDELRMALDETPRFVFIVTDYPLFKEKNYKDLRIRCFEIWPSSIRAKNFRELLENYYSYIYLEHIKNNPNKTPAPKNLFPDNYPFYMCNPIKIFECNIKDSLSDNYNIDIGHYIKPDKDRSIIKSEEMPSELLNRQEKSILKEKGFNIKELKYITEEMRSHLKLRDTDKEIKIIGNKKHKSIKG